VNDIEQFVGTFEGTGTWFDAAAKSGTYKIRQMTVATTGGFEVSFKHDFDDGTVVDARFVMTWVAPNVFRVDLGGTSLGHGYVSDDYCHYYFKAGDRFVEASYRANGEVLRVNGSSSTNAEGNFTAWAETLIRTR
jgi:hypothetical protein